MKNIQKIGILIAVVLAAGGAAFWSQLQAAPQAPPQADPPNRTSAMNASGGNASASISENGDGTANVSAFKVQFGGGFITSVLSGFDPANMSYSQTVNIRPGASGHQIGSGMGNATLAGTLLDFSTFTETPVTISFQMAVEGAGDAFAFNNHTLDVHAEPFSGPVTASRNVSIGTGASGPTAASISMSVDGTPYFSQAGIFGQVQAFTRRTVTRVR